MKRQLVVPQPAAADPLVARWLAYLEEGRARTLELVRGLSQDQLEQGEPNATGSLLYHIALIEADWLYVEILEQEIPADLSARFPHDVRDGEGRLVRVTGWPLARHLELLADVRRRLAAALQEMPEAEFLQVRRLERYDVMPEWVCLHLLQREAGHRGQIVARLGRAG